MRKLVKLLAVIFIYILCINHVVAAKWYEGGNLHSESALEWQDADRANKVATCADILAGFWRDKILSPDIIKRIKTSDNLKHYANELANELDAAFERVPDPVENKKLFANQKVATSAVMLMVMKGWIVTKN